MSSLCLEWAKAIFDLMKTLAWPASLLFLAWYFKDDLKNLSARITEASPTKLGFAPPQQADQNKAAQNSDLGLTASSTGETTAQVLANIRKLASDEEINPVLSRIRSEIPSDAVADPKKAIELLSNTTAGLAVVLSHEKAYRIIFGSQLRLLLSVNSSLAPFPLDEAKKLFFHTAATFPEQYKTINFEDWLNFPINFGLLRKAGDALTITPSGQGLLNYIVTHRLPADKAL